MQKFCVVAMIVLGCAAEAVRAQTNPFLPLQILDQTVYPATGNRYLLTSMTDWASAYDFAIDQGGWLWAVNDAREMNFVIDAFLPARAQYAETFVAPDGFQTGAPDLSLYIGFTDSELYGANEGSFEWVNGDPVTFTNWSGGEPNNVGQEEDPAGEDFGEIWNLTGNRTWNDDNDRGTGLNGLPPSTPARLPAGGNLAVVELPPIPPSLKLQVDPQTGYARVVSVSEASVMLRSYAIGDESGALDAAAWQASNLAARAVNAPGGVPTPGDRWQEVAATSENILEAFLFGGSPIAPTGSLVLGQITRPFSLESPPDLTFEFASTDPKNASPFATLDALVEFASFPVQSFLAADFNGDGSVNGADYSRWASGLGTTSGALRDAGDANADGAVEGRDFLIWQRQFGTLSGSDPALTAVPEPSATAIALSSLFFASQTLLGRRCRLGQAA